MIVGIDTFSRSSCGNAYYIELQHGEAGLVKIPMSQGLVTLLHICRVIPTPQSPISTETPPQVPISLRQALVPMFHLEHRCHCFEQRVFKCFMMFYECLMMFY